MSYDDYAALPDDGTRYEVANGVLELMSPAPSPVHQLICKNIEHLLDETCSTDFIILTSPIDVILGPKEVRQSDIAAVHRSRAGIITRRGIEGAPDLVVEILSPSSVKRDREQKLEAYALYGIPEYWIVTAELTAVEQYVSQYNDYVLKSVYVGEDVVQSDAIRCARVSMAEVMRRMPDLPNV